MNLNKAMVIGNLTRDPEIRTTSSGQTVASFGVATNFTWKDQAGQRQEKVEFHNIVAWRKLAEICGQYLHKGSKVYIEGRLQTSDWQGQDGVKRYKTEIVAENMIMLDRAPGASETIAHKSTEPIAASSEMPTESIDEPAPETPASASDSAGIKTEEIEVENVPF